jgi:hypothetical protein
MGKGQEETQTLCQVKRQMKQGHIVWLRFRFGMPQLERHGPRLHRPCARRVPHLGEFDVFISAVL